MRSSTCQWREKDLEQCSEGTESQRGFELFLFFNNEKLPKIIRQRVRCCRD